MTFDDRVEAFHQELILLAKERSLELSIENDVLVLREANIRDEEGEEYFIDNSDLSVTTGDC